jgi:hypothetical protein
MHSDTDGSSGLGVGSYQGDLTSYYLANALPCSSTGAFGMGTGVGRASPFITGGIGGRRLRAIADVIEGFGGR